MLNIFLFPLAISPKALFGPFQGMFCENARKASIGEAKSVQWHLESR